MAEQETAIGKEYNPNKHADPESLGYKRPKMAAEGEVDHIPTPPTPHENRHINPATMGSPMPDGRYPDKLANRKLSPYGTTEPKDEIPEKKRILLKRMLMGLTSYYPIDRSSIVDMPITKEPEFIDEDLKNHKIVQQLNVVPCMMSQTQFEKYMEMWSKEKSIDALARMRNYDEESPYNKT